MSVTSEMSSVLSKSGSFLLNEVMEAECLRDKSLGVSSISTIRASVGWFAGDAGSKRHSYYCSCELGRAIE